MSELRRNILFAGVGGQGVLLASELTARAAVTAGLDAKKTEVHGAAQRGGSVVSHVRFASRVYSPLCSAGDVDILLALEKLEGLRWAHYVRPGGLIVLNREERVPAQITEHAVNYPRGIDEFLTAKGFRVVVIDATDIAVDIGNFRAANSVLLGAVADQTGLAAEHWYAAMEDFLGAKILDLNKRAFEAGRSAVRHAAA